MLTTMTRGAALAAALLLAAVTPGLAQGGGQSGGQSGGQGAGQGGGAAARQQLQAQAQAPAGEAGGPERTSAQFGDWMVQCVVLPQTGRRACEMAQTVQDQQRQQPVAVVAIGRGAREQPMKLAVRVPVNVQVSAPAQFALEGASGPGSEPLAMTFQRCTINPVGCFAERELREDVLRRLRNRNAEQAARITWRDAGGTEIAIPVSFRGFAAAYDSLLREGS